MAPADDPIDVEAALAATRARYRGRQRRRRAVLGAVAGVIVLAGAVGVFAWSGRGGPERVESGPATEGTTSTVADSTVPGSAPPPVSHTEAFLWLSATKVPTAGADLAVFIVDPTASGDTWGVGVSLERWDGADWGDRQRGSVCMAFWGCVGGVDPTGNAGVPDIGLSADAGMGPLTWFTTKGLAPGWYRLASTSNEGTVAAGQFEVRDDAPEQPPADPGLPTSLLVQPPLRLATMSGSSALVTPSEEAFSGVDAAWWNGPATVLRWAPSATGTGMVWVAEGPASPVLGVASDLGGRSVELGMREPGAYKIMVEAPSGAVLEGRFWVEDPAESGGMLGG